MAIINETGDSVLNAHAHGSYNVAAGDVFNGTLSPTDHQDAINLTGLTPGQPYTISVDVADTAGTITLILVHHADFHSHGFNFVDGEPLETAGFDRHFASSTAPEADGNTYSFTFTPAAGVTGFAFALQTADNESYSVTFEEAVLENIVDGTTGNDQLKGSADLDIITGGAGDDHLDGYGGDDVLNGGEGKDKLTAGEGNDTLNGGDGNDLLKAGIGDDELNGGDRNDRMLGEAGNDTLNGGSGNDKLDGGADDDVLDGGAGKDVMTGGSGADSFVFGDGSHKDTITDFEDGVDLMDFSADASVTGLGDLAISQNGSDVVISHGGSDEITLQNFDIADIDATDFVF
ncbi:MAG: calcium-binding protein [Pseudomonadota bacterium]